MHLWGGAYTRVIKQAVSLLGKFVSQTTSTMFQVLNDF